MKRAVYPGSFDPITLGHLDVIERSSKLVDELIIGVLVNHAKTPLFSASERVKMIREVTESITNVKVVEFSGLSVDFARENGAEFIVRGLRAITDFEYELQMAQTNRIIAPEIDTIFLTTNLKYAYLSSTTVKEVASYGGDLSHFIPETLIGSVEQRIAEKKGKK